MLNRLEFLEAAQMQSVDRINQFEEENLALKKKLDAAVQVRHLSKDSLPHMLMFPTPEYGG